MAVFFEAKASETSSTNQTNARQFGVVWPWNGGARASHICYVLWRCFALVSMHFAAKLEGLTRMALTMVLCSPECPTLIFVALCWDKMWKQRLSRVAVKINVWLLRLVPEGRSKWWRLTTPGSGPGPGQRGCIILIHFICLTLPAICRYHSNLIGFSRTKGRTLGIVLAWSVADRILCGFMRLCWGSRPFIRKYGGTKCTKCCPTCAANPSRSAKIRTAELWLWPKAFLPS